MSSRTVKIVNNHSNKHQQPKSNKRHQKKPVVNYHDSSSSSEDDTPPTPTHQSSSLKRYHHYHQDKNCVDQVYAGPTFSNAPAPSALPIPAFNSRGSPINYPIQTLEQHSMDIMNLISPQKAYDSDLAEIKRGLCSMLKIVS